MLMCPDMLFPRTTVGDGTEVYLKVDHNKRLHTTTSGHRIEATNEKVVICNASSTLSGDKIRARPSTLTLEVGSIVKR